MSKNKFQQDWDFFPHSSKGEKNEKNKMRKKHLHTKKTQEYILENVPI